MICYGYLNNCQCPQCATWPEELGGPSIPHTTGVVEISYKNRNVAEKKKKRKPLRKGPLDFSPPSKKPFNGPPPPAPPPPPPPPPGMVA